MQTNEIDFNRNINTHMNLNYKDSEFMDSSI